MHISALRKGWTSLKCGRFPDRGESTRAGGFLCECRSLGFYALPEATVSAAPALRPCWGAEPAPDVGRGLGRWFTWWGPHWASGLPGAYPTPYSMQAQPLPKSPIPSPTPNSPSWRGRGAGPGDLPLLHPKDR